MRDWNRFNAEKKGRAGENMNPKNPIGLPTKKQIDTIHLLTTELKAEGLDAFFVESYTSLKQNRVWAAQLIRRLEAEKAKFETEHGLRPGVWKYVNLCKHRETGKTIHYVTKRKFSAPAGYICLGQVGTRFIPHGDEPVSTPLTNPEAV